MPLGSRIIAAAKTAKIKGTPKTTRESNNNNNASRKQHQRSKATTTSAAARSEKNTTGTQPSPALDFPMSPHGSADNLPTASSSLPYKPPRLLENMPPSLLREFLVLFVSGGGGVSGDVVVGVNDGDSGCRGAAVAASASRRSSTCGTCRCVQSIRRRSAIGFGRRWAWSPFRDSRLVGGCHRAAAAGGDGGDGDHEDDDDEYGDKDCGDEEDGDDENGDDDSDDEDGDDERLLLAQSEGVVNEWPSIVLCRWRCPAFTIA